MAAEKQKKEEKRISGTLAGEKFRLNERGRFWMKKSGNNLKSLTITEWEKFFKENKVI